MVAFVLLIALCASASLQVLAQGAGRPEEVVIHYPEPIAFPDTPDDLTLRLYFNINDANRRPVLDPKIRGAQIVLDPEDGGTYEANVEKAEGPIAIAMVLDASGSMAGAARAMQEAAFGLVQNGPSEARYAIIRFNNPDATTQLTDFTDDENLLGQAIQQVQPQDRAGTCLYDAALKGLEILATSAPTGRRALVIFTDGVDEVLGGAPCSRGTINDVITVATNRNLRIPMYTIGLQGTANRPIAEADLRNMAAATGGFAAIGTDIGSLFFEINNALNAQLVAEALVRPAAGERNAQLRILLDDGRQLPPASTVFTSPRDFSFKTPTPSLTFTPTTTSTATVPPAFSLPAPRIDPATREFLLNIEGIVSGDLIRAFRFELITEGGLGAGTFTQNAPIVEDVRIPIPDAPGQTFTIRVSALGENNVVLFQQDVRAGYEPTATATPTVTLTPPPVGAQIDSLGYADEVEKDALLIKLTLMTQEQIEHLRVTIVDRESNVMVRNVDPITVAPEIRISLEGVPTADYTVNVFAVGSAGQQLSLSSSPFRHIPATPTPTSTVTPTPTPVIPVAQLEPSINVDRQAGVFILTVQTLNETAIQEYQVELIDSQTRVNVRTLSIAVPPYDTIRVPIGDLAAGEYLLTLRGLDENGRVITAPSQIPFRYNPPPPTPTITPTPSATPEPNDPIYVLGKALNDPSRRPLVIGVLGALGLGLVLLLFLLLRRPKKAATGTGFLSEMTGAVDISKLEGYQGKGKAPAKGAAKESKSAPKAAPKASQSAARPAPPAMDMDDRTAPVPHMAMPQLTLSVDTSRHAPAVGMVVSVSHAPFTLGRKTRDLNFDNDDNVSRQHAEIVMDGDTFFIQDNNSTHGTFVDDRQVPPGTRAALYDGAVIRLGTTTLLRVSMPSAPGDPDKTSPEMPAYPR
ncbi:MAG: FHA domain-containing protein [Anaerolineae bacterium]|nr:FHA domain-containing protein [Anaerolineae bacterium]